MDDIVKALRWLAKETEFVFAAEQLTDAASLIESQAAEIAELREAQRWIPVTERLPEAEVEVIILTKSKTGRRDITTAMYEDGKMPTEESVWNWYDLDFDCDEENDVYLIPEGWWEYRHYNPDDVYNNAVDDEVIAWRPLPAPPEKAGDPAQSGEKGE